MAVAPATGYRNRLTARGSELYPAFHPAVDANEAALHTGIDHEVCPKKDVLQGTLEMPALRALLRGPLQGYCVVRHIERVSDEALRVEEGSLYPALHRQEQEGLIRSEWAISVPLLRGGGFDRSDDQTGRHVAILNETAVRHLWPAGGAPPDPHVAGLDAPTDPIVYMPLSSAPWSPNFVMVRTEGPPEAMAAEVRRAVADADPSQAVFLVASMPELLANSIAERRFAMLLLSVFGALAITLAAAGVYGLVSYSVARRTHEIGIRVALGASRFDVRRLVLGQGLAPGAVGMGVGPAGALALTRLLSAMLFGVSAHDPVVFALAPLLLLAVAAGACAVPAYRAMRVDPAIALRSE